MWPGAFLCHCVTDHAAYVEYTVPDETITAELLKDGTFLKRAIEICNRNRTQLNMLKLLKILRDSWVWIPCNAIMSDADYAAMEKLVMDAKDNLDSLVGIPLAPRMRRQPQVPRSCSIPPVSICRGDTQPGCEEKSWSYVAGCAAVFRSVGHITSAGRRRYG